MANKDDDLVLSVGAEANLDSAEKATKDLEKGVLRSLKDGYIPIPAELKVPIKGASKELKEAQKKLVDQWDKAFSNKGFSSSKKAVSELDRWNSAYSKFQQLARNEKKTSTAQYRGLHRMMENSAKDYKTMRKDLTGVELKAPTIKETKHRKTKTTTAGVAKRKRNYSSYDSVAKGMDYPTRSTDMSTTTKDLVEASDRRGPYRSKFNEQVYKSQAEERANEKKSLKLVAHLNDYNKERFRIKESRLARNAVSDEEANKGLTRKSRDEMRGNLVDLFKGMTDLSGFLSTLPGLIKDVVAHNEKAGVSLDKTISQLSEVMTSYFYNVGGRLGVNYDDDNSVPKYERSYLDAMEAAWKAVNEYIEKLQNTKDKNGVMPELARQLRLLGGSLSPKYSKRTGKMNGKGYDGIDEKTANKLIDQQLGENAWKTLFGKFQPDIAVDYNSDAVKAIDETATKLKSAGGIISEVANVAQKKLSGVLSGASPGPGDGGDPYRELTQAISQLGYYLRDIKDSIDKIAEGKRRWWPEEVAVAVVVRVTKVAEMKNRKLIQIYLLRLL